MVSVGNGFDRHGFLARVGIQIDSAMLPDSPGKVVFRCVEITGSTSDFAERNTTFDLFAVHEFDLDFDDLRRAGKECVEDVWIKVLAAAFLENLETLVSR